MTSSHSRLSTADNTTAQVHYRYKRAGGVNAFYREAGDPASPALLAVWGKHEPFFMAAGAEAWKRDIPDAEVNFYDTGHFALETHAKEIGDDVREFLDRNVRQAG